MLEEHQYHVLTILRAHGGEEMAVGQIRAAMDRRVPESTIAVALAELAHRGLVHRRPEVRSGRKRSVQWYRAVD